MPFMVSWFPSYTGRREYPLSSTTAITSSKLISMSRSVISTLGVIISDAVVSPNFRMPSSISLSSLLPSVISRARDNSEALMSLVCLVTTLFTRVPDFISTFAIGPVAR